MGTPYFKCDAKLNSLRKKKFITDIYKMPIYTITQEVLSLRGRFKFLYGDTEKVIGSVDPIRTFGNLYSVNFFNLAINRNDYLELACDYKGNRCGIFHGEAEKGAPLICRMTKRHDAKNAFLDLQNYDVEIAPNVDAAFMVGLSIVFDEIKNDKNKK